MPSVIHAIPVVEPGATGIHLLWSGPNAWLYSPGSWRLERRELDRRRDVECVQLAGATLAQLRDARELGTAIGTVLVRAGPWPGSAIPGAPPAGTATEVFTMELDRPAAFVRVISGAKWNFVVALRAGKVVGGGEVRKGPMALEIAAPGIDTVVAYALGMGELSFCRGRDPSAESWRSAQVIARLQLPLREAMAELGGFDDEIATARARLLPGEIIDDDEFRDIADLLRRMVRADAPPRPIDLVLLLREAPGDPFDELAALDPLRTLLLVPRWRRALGFAHFDRDPALVPGRIYEYRLTGAFPANEAGDRVAGFHTIPSTTALPADFHLGDVRVRLAQPSAVSLARKPAPADLRAVTRRGVRLRPRHESFWLRLDLDTDSAVIDFARPVDAVVLEVARRHALTFAAGDPHDSFDAFARVPPGPAARLHFATPITQLRLRGRGFLGAVRIAGGGGAALVEESVQTAPVTLAHTPPPQPPQALEITNLQAPAPIVADDQPMAPARPLEAPGFLLTWTPAATAGVDGWPFDLGAAPPLDATLFQIEHRPLVPADAPWTAILEDDNLVGGDRALPVEPHRVTPGGDLMQVFPEARPPEVDAEAIVLNWRDVFDVARLDDSGSDETPPRRPPPAPGTLHRYRVRSVDAIGRTSATWTESAPRRLEKRLSPPLPAGPDPRPAHALERAAPTGPLARLLVRDAPDLTEAERSLLGAHHNAILLTWGWHAEQRTQDPLVAEFRIYAARGRLDAQRARVDSIAETAPGRYVVDLHLERPVQADASAGLVLNAGYPFHLRSHGAGIDIQATIDARVARPDGSFPRPTPDEALFPLRLTPHATRAPSWGVRVEVVPLVAGRDVYAAAPIFDLLDLSPDHPRDEALVGVSAADAESYVDDPLAPVANRPGNEGAIAVVPCAGRHRGRPMVVDVPTLEPVPEIVSPFPGARPLAVRFDLSPILAGSGFAAGMRALPERVDVDELFRAHRTESGRVIARARAARPGRRRSGSGDPQPDRSRGDDRGLRVGCHREPRRLARRVPRRRASLPRPAVHADRDADDRAAGLR